MSKPSAPVIRTLETEICKMDVLQASEVYQVTYSGLMISIRRNQLSQDNKSYITYDRTSFSTRGHAVALADKLNKAFSTTCFEVRRVVLGQKED